MSNTDELSRITSALAESGWVVSTSLFDAPTLTGLLDEARREHAAGGFHAAAVGRAEGRGVRPAVRSDEVMWLDGTSAGEPSGPVGRYFAVMDEVRIAVNRALFLGLDELEAHFAVYPPGAAYQRHLDRFRDDDLRALSAVLYLNPAWPPEAGGQLRLFLDERSDGEPGGGGPGHVDVRPEAGTLVLFLSDRFWHEVLPATRARCSVTGWFRRRPALPRLG